MPILPLGGLSESRHNLAIWDNYPVDNPQWDMMLRKTIDHNFSYLSSPLP